MTHVKLRDGESIDGMLKRFQSMVQRSGIMRELRDRQYFRSRQESRRLEAQRNARRSKKRTFRSY